jgi:hypothetical protein
MGDSAGVKKIKTACKMHKRRERGEKRTQTFAILGDRVRPHVTLLGEQEAQDRRALREPDADRGADGSTSAAVGAPPR